MHNRRSDNRLGLNHRLGCCGSNVVVHLTMKQRSLHPYMTYAPTLDARVIFIQNHRHSPHLSSTVVTLERYARRTVATVYCATPDESRLMQKSEHGSIVGMGVCAQVGATPHTPLHRRTSHTAADSV